MGDRWTRGERRPKTGHRKSRDKDPLPTSVRKEEVLWTPVHMCARGRGDAGACKQGTTSFCSVLRLRLALQHGSKAEQEGLKALRSRKRTAGATRRGRALGMRWKRRRAGRARKGRAQGRGGEDPGFLHAVHSGFGR